MSNYLTLSRLAKTYVALESSIDLLLWDSAVMMPQSGYVHRAEQVASIKKIAARLFSSTKVKSLLDACKDEALSELQLKNLAIMEKLHINTRLIPQRLQEELDISTVICENIWQQAKIQNDFNLWKPHIAKVIKLTREVASRKADFYNISPYDTLLSIFDPEITSQYLDKIFNEIEKNLIKNMNHYVQKAALKVSNPIISNVGQSVKLQIIREILQGIGFDFTAGRLDFSSHPFCRGMKDDVRITIKSHKEEDLWQSILSALHEAGHAIYVQNIDECFKNELVGISHNMAIHESQSLFYECYIGKNFQFMEFLCSIVNKHIDAKVTVDAIYRTINGASLGFIRTEADEYTYPLHIIHRYNMEKLLINESFKVDDLPDVWNQEFQKLFGRVPSSHQEGCLQDVHWSAGYFGYFPCYLTGKVIASQIKSIMDEQIGIANEIINIVRLNRMKSWLNTNIHRFGGYYNSRELVHNICGEAINPVHLLKHIHDSWVENCQNGSVPSNIM